MDPDTVKALREASARESRRIFGRRSYYRKRGAERPQSHPKAVPWQRDPWIGDGHQADVLGLDKKRTFVYTNRLPKCRYWAFKWKWGDRQPAFMHVAFTLEERAKEGLLSPAKCKLLFFRVVRLEDKTICGLVEVTWRGDLTLRSMLWALWKRTEQDKEQIRAMPSMIPWASPALYWATPEVRGHITHMWAYPMDDEAKAYMGARGGLWGALDMDRVDERLNRELRLDRAVRLRAKRSRLEREHAEPEDWIFELTEEEKRMLEEEREERYKRKMERVEGRMAQLRRESEREGDDMDAVDALLHGSDAEAEAAAARWGVARSPLLGSPSATRED